MTFYLFIWELMVEDPNGWRLNNGSWEVLNLSWKSLTTKQVNYLNSNRKDG